MAGWVETLNQLLLNLPLKKQVNLTPVCEFAGVHGFVFLLEPPKCALASEHACAHPSVQKGSWGLQPGSERCSAACGSVCINYTAIHTFTQAASIFDQTP